MPLAHEELTHDIIGAAIDVTRAAFGWFRHNPFTTLAADLDQRRFGAMRAPLREIMTRYGVDLLIPLASESSVLAVLGFKLARPPDDLDREPGSHERKRMVDALHPRFQAFDDA